MFTHIAYGEFSRPAADNEKDRRQDSSLGRCRKIARPARPERDRPGPAGGSARDACPLRGISQGRKGDSQEPAAAAPRTLMGFGNREFLCRRFTKCLFCEHSLSLSHLLVYSGTGHSLGGKCAAKAEISFTRSGSRDATPPTSGWASACNIISI